MFLQEIMGVARQLGLTQLAIELYEDQTALRRVFSRYGFREEGRIPVYQGVLLVRDLAEEQENPAAEPAGRKKRSRLPRT